MGDSEAATAAASPATVLQLVKKIRWNAMQSRKTAEEYVSLCASNTAANIPIVSLARQKRLMAPLVSQTPEPQRLVAQGLLLASPGASSVGTSAVVAPIELFDKAAFYSEGPPLIARGGWGARAQRPLNVVDLRRQRRPRNDSEHAPTSLTAWETVAHSDASGTIVSTQPFQDALPSRSRSNAALGEWAPPPPRPVAAAASLGLRDDDTTFRRPPRGASDPAARTGPPAVGPNATASSSSDSSRAVSSRQPPSASTAALRANLPADWLPGRGGATAGAAPQTPSSQEMFNRTAAAIIETIAASGQCRCHRPVGDVAYCRWHVAQGMRARRMASTLQALLDKEQDEWDELRRGLAPEYAALQAEQRRREVEELKGRPPTPIDLLSNASAAGGGGAGHRSGGGINASVSLPSKRRRSTKAS